MGERIFTFCIFCDYIKTPIDKIKGTTTRYVISLFPFLPLAYESLTSGTNMPWCNAISNWATHFAKLFSCDHNNPERMIDSELHSYTRHTDDENHSSEQESSSTMCAEHSRGRKITKPKETILHDYKQQKHIMQTKINDENQVTNRRNENPSAEQKLNSDVDGAQRTNDLQPADNQNCIQCIPEELISSIKNMALTLPNIPQDQAPGPSHGNNVEIDYRTTSTVHDIQLCYPPRNWLPPRTETSSQRRVYSNNKHHQEKPDFSGIAGYFNIPETGCNNSNISVIECRPPQNWVNVIEKPRLEQTPVYHGEFSSQKSKTHVANPTNQESGSNIPSCSHNKQKLVSKETETPQHRLPQQVNYNTTQDIAQADGNVDDSEYNQLKLSKLDQPSEEIKEEVTAAASVISAQKRDSYDNELKPKRAKQSDDQRQKEEKFFIVPGTQQKELEPIRIRTNNKQIKMLEPKCNAFHCPTTSNSDNFSISILIENDEQNLVRPFRKRRSDSEQIHQPKRRAKALLVEIITDEILNNFECNLEETGLTPYERNYLGRIYDILKKCKEFEMKLDSIHVELDEQRLYYFEENLQRNMEKLDRIDPQESKILGEKRKDVIKYIYKIIEKLEDKSTIKPTIE